MHLHVLSETCLWISLWQGIWCYSLVNKAIICQSPMVCLGCLMVEDLLQWLLWTSLTIQFGSVSFRFMVFQWKRWRALPQSLLTGSSTYAAVVTIHMLCWWDLLQSLLIWPSMFTVDGTFHKLCWWGPSTCNVNGTFYMQCWWDLPNTLMMGWRDFVPCSCKLISDKTAMEQKETKNSFEVGFWSIVYTLTSKSCKL